MSEQASPEPGWYPDPSGAARLRWWNGVSWSDSTHPLPGAPAETVAPAPYPTIFGDDAEEAAPGRRRRGGVVAAVMAVALLGIAIVAVLALLNAVSSRTRLDTAAIEQQVAESLSQSSGLTTTVVCPDDVTLERGATFECTATTDSGLTARIQVTQDDDQGNVTWRVV